MRLALASFLLAGAAVAAPPAPIPPPAAPYVVRVLALGHEPDRKYKVLSNGFLAMLELDPRELPPSALYLRLPKPPVTLPGAKAPDHVACTLQLNGVQETTLPSSVPPGETLPIELQEVVPQPAGAKGAAEKTYKEIGEIKRGPDATSSLVVLYNPVGRKTWDGVKPFVIDTSEKTLPPGTLLVYNLCAETLYARIGSAGAGTLAPGQSAFVRPKVGEKNYFDMRLALQRNGDEVQLVDSARELAPGARGLLVVYPQPPDRNTRGADFVLYLFPPDPKPEPVAVPGAGPAGTKAAAR